MYIYTVGRVFRGSPNVNRIVSFVHRGNFQGRIQKVGRLPVAYLDVKLKWLEEKRKERKRNK